MNECKKGTCGTTQIKPSPDTQEDKIRKSLERIKHVIMVMSGKGGVGKTSVAVNLAIALSEKGFRTGLMDVDIHGPDVPRMLGIQGMLDLNAAQKLTPMAYSDTLKAVSIESLIAGRDTAIIWRGPMKYSVINQFVGDVDWGELDVLLVDLPPSTGDIPISLTKHSEVDGAVVVVTPQDVALDDARKAIGMFKRMQVPVLGVVENMSYFVCEECETRHHLFGQGGGQRLAGMAGVPFLGEVPLEPAVRAGGDGGRPVVLRAGSLAGQAFHQVAERVWRSLQPAVGAGRQVSPF